MKAGRRPRVVVTGARGYLGSRLVAGLEPAADVVRLVRPGTAADGEIGVAVDDRPAMAALIGSLTPDVVVHAAGRVMGSPDELRRDNVATALAVAEAVLEAAPGAALTVLGSAAEYGPPLTSEPIAETHPCRPVTAYGRAKWEASRQILRLAERRGLRANIVRPFNVIGVPLSDAQVLGAFVAKAAEIYDADAPRRVMMGPLGAVRDFVSVGDLVLLVRSLVRDDRSGILVNVCSGMGRRVRDLVAFLNALSDDRFTVIEEDAAPLSASAVIGDPSLFLKLAGVDRPTPIEPLLVEAWCQAMATRSRKEDG